MRHECILVADRPGAFVEVCGVSVLERLLRTLQRLGLPKVTILSASPELQQFANFSPHRAELVLDVRGCAGGPVSLEQIAGIWPDHAQDVLVIPGDLLIDSRLLQLLDEQKDTTALVDAAPPQEVQPLVASLPKTSWGRLCGPALISREWVQKGGSFAEALRADVDSGAIHRLDIADHNWYLAAMRREARPFCFPAPPFGIRKIAERALLEAAQKGTLDLPALIHAPIENFLVSHLCKTRITPNEITFFTNLVAWAVTFLFASGHIAWGAGLALAIGVLDGLDGKQARVKVETSKRGKLEHWFDALFENSWWIALAYYFQVSGQLPHAYRYLMLFLAGEGIAGLAKGSVARICGHSIYELGNFDRVIRLIGARRNIHIWILTVGVLFGRAAEAFMVMASWEAITATIQATRAFGALVMRRRIRTDWSEQRSAGSERADQLEIEAPSATNLERTQS